MGTIGLGTASEYSRSRVPKPPQKRTTFIPPSFGTLPAIGAHFTLAGNGAPDLSVLIGQSALDLKRNDHTRWTTEPRVRSAPPRPFEPRVGSYRRGSSPTLGWRSCRAERQCEPHGTGGEDHQRRHQGEDDQRPWSAYVQDRAHRSALGIRFKQTVERCGFRGVHFLEQSTVLVGDGVGPLAPDQVSPAAYPPVDDRPCGKLSPVARGPRHRGG